MYIRFAIYQKHPRSDQPMGVFSALYDLERQGQLAPYELDWFREIEQWFNEHLTRPTQLATSRRPNAENRAISWFRDSATEHIAKMRELVTLLRYKDVEVKELRTERPGYVVYEDEYQVATLPFADSKS